MRGQFNYIGDGKKPGPVGSLGDGDELKKLHQGGDWNDIHIIARGNTIIQLINGHVMAQIVDDDKAGRKMDGLIGIQLHKTTGADEDRVEEHPAEGDVRTGVRVGGRGSGVRSSRHADY